MRSCIFLVTLLALASSATAKDFPVNDQDQGNVMLICRLARTAPGDDVLIANVAAFCVTWKQRMEAAAREPVEKKEESDKPAANQVPSQP